jgi:ADP-heptose:LPS heptosyltransferase
MWESFLRLARVLNPGLSDDLPAIELGNYPGGQDWVEKWWNNIVCSGDRVTVALHLGSSPGMDYKRWPLERFLALAERLHSRWRDTVIILTGTELERDLIREFRAKYIGTAIDASNLGSIERTGLILKRCALLVSNDTGVMHLGAAVGTPTIGLFGATSSLQWAPSGERAIFLQDSSLQCSPCANTYLGINPLRCKNIIVGECMTNITVDSVEHAIVQVLGTRK